jgi:hypothetical protein
MSNLPLRQARSREGGSYRILTSIVLLAMGWHPAPAGAATEAPSTSMFSFNGFGTLGIVHSNNNQADFVGNIIQGAGPGFTQSWSATPDSKLGLQLTANLTDRLSAVVQVLSQYQHDRTFKPDVEWANLKFQFTPDLDLRAGRIAIPTYMYSDSLNIGYTLPFVRIPIEIYSQLPLTHSDGIDGSYRFHVGAATNTVQVYVGRFDSKLPEHGRLAGSDLHGIADTLEYGNLSVHLSYQTLTYDIDDVDLIVFRNPQRIVSIGTIYDGGKWFAAGEWIRAPDDQLGLYYCWFAMSGYHIGKFTPYAGYARAYPNVHGSAEFPPFIDQDTASFGLRWDFMKNTDLKLQFDHIALHGGLDAFFDNQQPGFNPNSKISLFSLAVDFVF